MKTVPYWWEEAEPAHGEQCIDFDQCDVLIIGSGYTGLSAAITLAEGGVSKVIVVDEMRVGEGASSRNGGLYGTQPKFKYEFAKRKFGNERAKEIFEDYYECTKFMLSRAETLKNNFSLQVNGNIKGAHSLKDFREMESYYDSLPAIEKKKYSLYKGGEIKEVINTDIYKGALVNHNLGGIHPAKYVHALAEKAKSLGVRIFTGWQYQSANQITNNYEATLQRIDLKKKVVIKAKHIVIAVNGYAGSQLPWLRRRIIPMRSYMVATEELPYEQLEALIPSNRVVSDTKRILYYFRRSPDGRRILFGGRARFQDTTAEQSAEGLKKFLTHVFPSLKNVKITHSWFGNVCFSFDLMSHAGRMDNGIYYSSSCNGSGISMATYLGHRTAESILGKPDSDRGIMNIQFPKMPFYNGNPWFLPIIGAWYRFLDRAVLYVDK